MILTTCCSLLGYPSTGPSCLPPVEVIRRLFPESHEVKDHFGMLPLHLAFDQGIAYEVILLLLEQAPETRLVFGLKEKGCIEIALQGKSTRNGRDSSCFRGGIQFVIATTIDHTTKHASSPPSSVSEYAPFIWSVDVGN